MVPQESQATKNIKPSIAIDPDTQTDYGNLFYRVALGSDGKPDTRDGQVHLVPLTLKEYTKDMELEDKKEKEPLWFRWIFPISLLLNILLSIGVAVLGLWTPFVVTMFLSVIFLILIYWAGENYWLWVQVALNKKKNWALKLFSYATGKKVLVFQQIKETEKFVYFDKGNKKRYAETSIRNLDNVTNLGLKLAIIREGYPVNINLEDNYQFEEISRQLSQKQDMSYAAGKLDFLDQLMDLLKGMQQPIWVYIALAVIAILLVAVIIMLNNQPGQIAEALKPMFAQLMTPDVNGVSGTVVQVVK
jgi:hypothetical protein